MRSINHNAKQHNIGNSKHAAHIHVLIHHAHQASVLVSSRRHARWHVQMSRMGRKVLSDLVQLRNIMMGTNVTRVESPAGGPR